MKLWPPGYPIILSALKPRALRAYYLIKYFKFLSVILGLYTWIMLLSIKIIKETRFSNSGSPLKRNVDLRTFATYERYNRSVRNWFVRIVSIGPEIRKATIRVDMSNVENWKLPAGSLCRSWRWLGKKKRSYPLQRKQSLYGVCFTLETIINSEITNDLL